MKIISRYILREHAGPLAFTLAALTSLMLLNYISRQFGELVGKGLQWPVIGEFFLLSIPFTIALTVPMSVLVAVLYAFSRLAAENEVTALKASGVSPWRLVFPALVGGLVMSMGLLAFNDQVLPRANHRLKTLLDDISQTKPSLLLKEQVVNTISEGKFYLKAGKIDRSRGSAEDVLKEVVIYDLSDPTRRRTIYADSGKIAFAHNRIDLDLDLFHGQMQEVATDKPSRLDRLFYDSDRLKFRDVGRDFKQSKTDSASKGDREMGVCEMQHRLWQADMALRYAQSEYAEAKATKSRESSVAHSSLVRGPEPRGLGWLYCSALGRLMQVREAHAAELGDVRLHSMTAQDTIKADTVKRDTAALRKISRDTTATDTLKQDTTAGERAKRDSVRAAVAAAMRRDSAGRAAATPPAPEAVLPPAQTGMTLQNGKLVPIIPPTPAAIANVVPVLPGAARDSQAEIAARAAAQIMKGVAAAAAGPTGLSAREAEAKLRMELAQRQRNAYDIEIQKKFSLAAACLIFVIVAAPVAVRFPRGGVGLVIGVSLVVFALYYVGLIGGEALARRALLPPFWAMWGTNVIMTSVGIVMMLRMGHDSDAGRGGGLRDRIDAWQLRREMRRKAGTLVGRPASEPA